MGLIDGDEFVSGDILSFQQGNRLKDNWIQADPQTNLSSPQDGMAVVDSDDDKFYLYSGSAYEEILQLTRSFDVSPQFASLRLMDTPGADHYLDFICNEELTGNKTFHLIVNDINAELNINTKEALGIGEALRENLLINSGLGVWSQSDTNKGIGYLDFDSGSVAPVVGETLTGATSGATGKVIWINVTGGTWGGGNAAGTVYLGACSTACFNDDETITGSVGGANIMTVNQPDGAVGTDGFVKNGAFVHDIDPPNDWAAGNSATLTTEAGGQTGNCILIARNGVTHPSAYQQLTGLTIGKIYKFTLYAKQKEEATVVFFAGSTVGNNDYFTYTWEAPADWTTDQPHIFTWEAIATSCYINLQVATNNGTDGAYFDGVTVYEITPGCTAVDTLAPDGGWVKSTTLEDLYREHWGATYTKEGSFYSMKIVPTTINDRIIWHGPGHDKEEFYKQFAGRTVTLGAWIYASTASHCRLGIRQTSGYTYSSYHSGTPGWEWLEVPATIAVNTVRFSIYIITEQAPNVDGSTIVYVSQPMFVFGSSIGEGNYRARQQEVIWCDAYIPSNLLDAYTGLSDVGVTDLNLEADSDARLSKGIKAIYVYTKVGDSGSAGADCYVYLRANVAQGLGWVISPYGLTNNATLRMTNWQKCDENGDIDYVIEATGVNTFSVYIFRYLGVQVN